MTAKLIHVAAAAIEDDQGRILISKRHAHVHQGGLWEFPGGKLESGETVSQALQRELLEELNVTSLRSEPLIRITHHYTDRSVLLDVHRVKEFAGSPQGMEGQPLQWLHPQQMRAEDFPAADRPILSALRLPDCYLITGHDPAQRAGFIERLGQALSGGLSLVQLRAHELPDEAYRLLLETVLIHCRNQGARLLINRPQYPERWVGRADGIHLTRYQLMAMERRLEGAGLLGASCHDPVELRQAERLGLDYALLSPVQQTRSHPAAQPLGWERFARWVDDVNLPVYALGGVGMDDLLRAKWNGGQGIAGISGFWPSQKPKP
ncbi:MAG: Nudix family hydrolase [Gammaproteobacteria bacterium]|nr:Nudix family hydrolase [Gammaproteobacteria bacterium]